MTDNASAEQPSAAIETNPLLSDEEIEFSAMFEASQGNNVTRQDAQSGELVTGTVVGISHDSVFVDIGAKAEGVLERIELGDSPIAIGDTIEAMVISTRGEVRLTKSLGGASSKDSQILREAVANSIPVQGTIKSRNKGGFEVDIGGHRGFLPVSHVALESVPEDALDTFIGQSHRFKVLEYDPLVRKLVVSRTTLLREEREEQAAALWSELLVGQQRMGKVRSLQTYGAFIDVGGVDGLLHVKEMSWTRIEHPSELLTVGQDIEVTVIDVDRERKRIGLSMKSAQSDPWTKVGTDIRVGDVREGTVSRLESFGAFVELIPAVEGLVHTSEMTYKKRIRHPSDIVRAGDSVSVTVLDIDPVRRRISLSMKQVEGNPWAAAESSFPPGTRVSGKIERIAPFGVFIQIAPGVTALLPGSETEFSGVSDLTQHFRPGTIIEANVLAVDAERRRISLSTREDAGTSRSRKGAPKLQHTTASTAGGSGLGTFADLLKDVKLKQ